KNTFMKKLLILILFIPFTFIAQEIATTEDGRRVFLKADGTYEFLKNSSGDEINKKLNGEIKGVVTYFFNDNYGNKPDIGSEVMIRKTNEEDSTRFMLSNFY